MNQPKSQSGALPTPPEAPSILIYISSPTPGGAAALLLRVIISLLCFTILLFVCALNTIVGLPVLTLNEWCCTGYNFFLI